MKPVDWFFNGMILLIMNLALAVTALSDAPDLRWATCAVLLGVLAIHANIVTLIIRTKP
jgi:hypothetical protein